MTTPQAVICRIAQARDIGNLCRWIVEMFHDEFHHRMRSLILVASRRKLERLMTEEISADPSPKRLIRLIQSVGHVGDAVWIENCRYRDGDPEQQVRPWLEIENALANQLARLVWEDVCAETFTESVARYLKWIPHMLVRGNRLEFYYGPLRYSPRNIPPLDLLRQHIIHRLIRLATTPTEIRIVAELSIHVIEGRYILSNAVIPKWLSLVDSFGAMLEVLLWRPEGSTIDKTHYWDFQKLHDGMYSVHIQKFCESLLRFCHAESDFETITRYLGGGVSGIKQGDAILYWWYRLTTDHVFRLVEKELRFCSEPGLSHILLHWRRLGYSGLDKRIATLAPAAAVN